MRNRIIYIVMFLLTFIFLYKGYEIKQENDIQTEPYAAIALLFALWTFIIGVYFKLKNSDL